MINVLGGYILIGIFMAFMILQLLKPNFADYTKEVIDTVIFQVSHKYSDEKLEELRKKAYEQIPLIMKIALTIVFFGIILLWPIILIRALTRRIDL